MKSRLANLLPWVAGSLVLAFVFWRVPLAELTRATQQARLETFLPLILGACVAWFLIDAAAFAALFGRFNAPLSFRQARELRGLTYLLTPIHWNVGRAAVVARLHTTHRVPLLEATSSMAFYQTLDAILVSALCWIGLAGTPAGPFFDVLAWIVGALFVSLVAYLALIRLSCVVRVPLDRVWKSTFHRTHRLATARDVATLLGLRLAYYVVFVGLYFWGAAAFGIELPLALVVASVPIIQSIGALPISPAGLGTQQAAMLFLFSGHGPDASIVGFGLSFPILAIVFRCLIGWPYVRRLSRGERTHETPVPPLALTSATQHPSRQRS